jgi:NAD(P)-dependent dehydrogenase (short-subunit alcohol dehydrogenase family)
MCATRVLTRPASAGCVSADARTAHVLNARHPGSPHDPDRRGYVHEPDHRVITGCTSGFGYDLALEFELARRGDRVYATIRDRGGRNAEAGGALRDLARAKSLDLRVLDLDVTDGPSVEAAAEAVIAESRAADVVVNNAGYMPLGITEAFTAEEFSRLLDANVVTEG